MLCQSGVQGQDAEVHNSVNLSVWMDLNLCLKLTPQRVVTSCAYSA